MVFSVHFLITVIVPKLLIFIHCLPRAISADSVSQAHSQVEHCCF